VTRTHYRDPNPVVDFSFICTRCSREFTGQKPTRTCPPCRVGAMKNGGWDPEMEAEMSGV
jgi:hypothetical protein